ncbi:MAG: histidine kinase [Firmicutes bacterium HGW-Firmicutes-7]|nr:MAG: histidine kinase [Firmicutes bacterium HGW-Firmicutes-7]
MKRRGLLVAFLFLLLFSVNCIAKNADIDLTEDEKDFITEHQSIRLGIDPQFIPFEFLDSDGEYKGIASDYIKLLSEKIGIQMVVAKDLTWVEAYGLAVDKQLDVLPCVSLTREREQFFLYSEPYYQFQRVIVLKESNDTIDDIGDLFQTKVAVQSNSSHHSALSAYPSIELSLYPTVEAGIAAVTSGKELAFIGNLATSSYHIKANGFTQLKFIEIDSYENQELHFAVRNDWPELVSIINKGLASITEEEKIEINNKWIGLNNGFDYGPTFRIIAVVGSMILIILLVSIYWIVQLKKEVAKRIQIEEDLRRAKEEAEVANHIKSSFLARMSHEIRTPLNAITGMAYLIKKTDVNITQKIYLEKITHASHNMLGIINDILDFSKIEAGKVEIERISFNLDKVLQQVVSIMAFKIEEQEIGFNLNKDPNIPCNFWGDPKRLEQILLNLINNAVKFTSKGEVNLGIRLVEKEEPFLQLEFSVKDSGIGMSSEQVNQLFKPFAQGDSSINRRFGGTGLGLSIVKSLVEMMGGEIKVSSVQDEGSIFTILLVLEVDQDKEFESKQKIACEYIRDVKAIVLDKSIANLHLIEGYLHYFGMKAKLVTCQAQVVQLLETCKEDNSKPYELLILDYDTPEEGGLAFLTKISSNPLIICKPKVMMMIPLMREDLFEKIDDFGVEIGITKPIIPSVLYNGILDIFNVKELESKEASSLTIVNKNQRLERSFRVLVVEDNKTNQFIAKSILEQVGFEVVLADHGEEGVAYFIANQKEIHIILMDLHMPVLNGYEAAVKIRQLDANVPIVAMTADAITGIEEECKRVGINYYISKPFDPDELIETLINILKLKKVEYEDKDTIIEQGKDKRGNGDILDEADGLRRIGNNLALYQTILSEYLDENKDTVEVLTQAIKVQNYSEAIQIVHKNKGGSGNIGAKKLQNIASDLQKALQKDNQFEVERLHDVFAHTLSQLLREIERKIKE